MPYDERGQHQGAESKPDDRHCAAKTIREANGSRAEQNHHSVVKEISAVINNSGLLDSVQLMESGLINFLHGVFLCLPGAMRLSDVTFYFIIALEQKSNRSTPLIALSPLRAR